MPIARDYLVLASLILASVSAFHPNAYYCDFSAQHPNRRRIHVIGKVGRKYNARRLRPSSPFRSPRSNHNGDISSGSFGSSLADSQLPHDETTNTTSTDGGQRNATSNSHKRNSIQVTPDLVADLKSSIPLTQVVESFNLPQFRQTSPTRAVALCPFHNDNNPSMHIDDERGLYKCFSCGAGGDVFNFVREYKLVEEGGEKIGFIDAVKFVAEEYADGNLSAGSSGEGSRSRFRSQQGEGSAELTKEQRVRRERLALANAAAAEFYGKCLASLPAAGAARSHLRSRGVQPETVRRFALGFAPDAYFGQQGRRRERGGCASGKGSQEDFQVRAGRS